MLENCFNYVGSKDRIFPLIDENLDKSKKNLVDLFCGSGVVGVNELSNYSKIVLNDACWQMTELLKFFRDNTYEKVISEIDHYINLYKLSLTNKEGYNELREAFNEEPYLKHSIWNYSFCFTYQNFKTFIFNRNSIFIFMKFPLKSF